MINFEKSLEAILILMLDWGWLARMQNVFMPVCFIYLSLLICSHIALECALVHSIIFFFCFTFHHTKCCLLLAQLWTSILKLSWNKLCYSYASCDVPYMSKTAEAKHFSLMKVFCRCMDGVGEKISNGNFISRSIKSPAI